MKDIKLQTDSSILEELGRRLVAIRLEKNLRQEEVANEAGIGVRTLQRLESGSVASRLSSLVRVMRALGILNNLENLVPAPSIRPMTLLQREKRIPKRVTHPRKKKEQTQPWTWNE